MLTASAGVWPASMVSAQKNSEKWKHIPAGELAIMRTIKAAMDPQLILNPGKIFDL